MPSNNLTSLLSLASASSRIRESQRSQITTASGLGSRTSGFAESTSNSESSQTGNRVSRAPSQTPSTPSRRHRRASSLDSSPISAVPSAPKRQRVGDSQVIVSQEHLERVCVCSSAYALTLTDIVLDGTICQCFCSWSVIKSSFSKSWRSWRVYSPPSRHLL